ncbi:hypothetical protein DYB25_004626 [Aphanomyces astaci]|uniref:Uncharacterized protein n=1 Tax=Aphanomyces astaci TaxID=112090 RepID=A0A397CQI8_APHAT|nr:hypothetical protein DYB25_004626 [Aphanomyces astaci]RHY40790.1 hypothetical protein DYB30_004007 [Aphanomyces astaci]RHY47674.1 hypothetical protein DYB38_001860 [Aphanomyces astaci]RHY50699.1 hypothetical protein DYB34_005582 [Aphanomyces astaci]RHY85604.1 hypothetical protein DYB26_003381 [Aphanomyces astaci]
MWTKQTRAVHSARTPRHTLCKFKSALQMNHPQRFTSARDARNNGTTSKANGAWIFQPTSMELPLEARDPASSTPRLRFTRVALEYADVNRGIDLHLIDRLHTATAIAFNITVRLVAAG